MVYLLLMFYWLGAFEGLESNDRKHLTQSRWNFVCLWLNFPVSLNLFELQGCYEKFSVNIVDWTLKKGQLTAWRVMQKGISTAAVLCSLSLAIPEVQRKSNCFVTFSHKSAVSPQLGIEQACLTNLKRGRHHDLPFFWETSIRIDIWTSLKHGMTW